ncbi:hypothetical protein CSA56_19100 [candidate division KSB3 bacterium]|uniref:Uncharacterized protein n=1 Tax=candidate division KSB3 bacterium TaxID=2044937 RepID=A0A2G6K685_9BACT|nr:MAG: hypothetical protein CSA56_19100 [candidate division KSB3 bacterium]
MVFSFIIGNRMWMDAFLLGRRPVFIYLDAKQNHCLGAIAAKTRAWGIRNSRKYEGIIVGAPDVQSSIVDQLYIQSPCKGESGAECMGKTWQRTPIVDQAVEETWDAVLKRHDCFYMYGTSAYPDYQNKCPGVFETSYNRTQSGCGHLFSSNSCLPQNDARTLVEEKNSVYQDVLKTYYEPLSLYEQQEIAVTDDAQEIFEVEALSGCMTIHYKVNGDRQFLCKKSKYNSKKIVPLYFPEGGDRRTECHEDPDICPLGDKYVDVGTKGVLLETKVQDKKLWFKVQWKVKTGSDMSDDRSESVHVIEGWSRDEHIKPADASSLVVVQIIGARLKAKTSFSLSYKLPSCFLDYRDEFGISI